MIADVASTRDELISLATRVKNIGFFMLLLRDHVVSHPLFGHQLGPLVAMATVAAHTNQLRIGTLAINNDFWPPVQLAKEFATLDVLSDGQIEFDLGAGLLRSESKPLGIPFASPGVRVSRLEESIRLLKLLHRSDAATFHGQHSRVDAFDGFPVSLQPPRMPILALDNAIMLDPLPGALLTLDQIRAMTDELVTAHRDLLPDGLSGAITPGAVP